MKPRLLKTRNLAADQQVERYLRHEESERPKKVETQGRRVVAVSAGIDTASPSPLTALSSPGARQGEHGCLGHGEDLSVGRTDQLLPKKIDRGVGAGAVSEVSGGSARRAV